ncbi:hypothetical protein HPB51_004393 [Rhipicephalus microplus]|uniref:Transposable element n=1 Tax=Rhipicephalus microplus TaxID=6941 RepID=A0A9J6EM73_RHIMP|nr:hypothetical protein HPB51_004393 [Rhipicephalus microplus]
MAYCCVPGCKSSFCRFWEVDETVEFMETVYRWFLLMDVSNCSQHIHQNNPDSRQFDSESDERLEWKMSSDPIESFFGWLRKSAGSNDQTDARAVLSRIEKMLKTGIASKSDCSNVISVENSNSSSAMLRDQPVIAVQAAEHFPREALIALSKNLSEGNELLPTPDIAALAMVGGYLARAIGERTSCEECLSLLTKPGSSGTSDALIKHQDRGGLL